MASGATATPICLKGFASASRVAASLSVLM